MVDLPKASDAIVTSTAPTSAITSGVIQQQANQRAAAIDSVATGLMDVSKELAKNQAADDLMNQKITRNPDGSVNVENPASAPLLFGDAARAYHEAVQTGTIAQHSNALSQDFADLHTKYPTDPAAFKAAAEAGAAYVGFVFFERSPRHLGVLAAREAALAAPRGVVKVGLTVDAADGELEAILNRVPLDMLQLHGHESPARVAEVRARFGLPVMKAVGVAGPEDLAALDDYAAVADQILVDAKPPKGAVLPGGNGLAFDWRLIAARRWLKPWMLAGGLTPGNVAEAIRLTGARQVDVSSGVETAPGVKDEALIRAFIAAARR